MQRTRERIRKANLEKGNQFESNSKVLVQGSKTKAALCMKLLEEEMVSVCD